MNGIHEKTNAALASVFDHFYGGMPEFAENEEPASYAVYFIREKPSGFASGAYHAKSYWVSVSVITVGAYDYALYERTEAAFRKAGFTYADGTQVGGYEGSEPYPHRHQYTQEYLLSIDLEENENGSKRA